MKINNLVDRNCTIATILEDTRDIFERLKGNQYLVVIDETLSTTGIITLKDLLNNSDARIIMDCDFTKPRVHSGQTIFEVFALMKQAETDFLPVYDNNKFIGVISLLSITERLAKVVNEKQQNHQKVVQDLRNHISNFQGLTNILNISLDDEENQELIHLCNLSCKGALNILDDLLFVELDESRP